MSLNVRQRQNQSLLQRYHPKLRLRGDIRKLLVDWCSRPSPKILAAEGTFGLIAVTEKKSGEANFVKYQSVDAKATFLSI